MSSRRVGRRVVPTMESGKPRGLAAPDHSAPGPDEKPTLRQRWRYGFDNMMARGTPALVGGLAIITVGLIALFSLVVLVGNLAPEGTGGGRPGTVRQFFNSLLHALDPGTIAGDGGRWPFLVAMLLLTLAGLLIVSALIGILATGLDSRIQELRKGRSVVLERDHTLILGWSDTIFTILSELEIANESESNPSVVVMADLDKVEMDDEIRAKVPLERTRVITRSGSPIDLGYLDLVSPASARSIIILAPASDPEADSQVIKMILALTQGIGHRDRRYHIVAEIQDPGNLVAAGLVAGDEAVLIDKRQTIARLLVHAARQSGASIAFTELLDFAGDEIYFAPSHGFTGKPYSDTVRAYEECSVIGILDAEGEPELNPPHERVLAEGEQLIAIAADDSALAQAEPCTTEPILEAISTPERTPFPPERVLILGWGDGTTDVINEFDEFLAEGSEIVVVADHEEGDAMIAADCVELTNSEVRYIQGSMTHRPTLESLKPEDYDHVMVLCSALEADPQRADARTLVTLLHLRDIAEMTGAEFSIVSEMLDDRNRQLAEVTQVDDVIVSAKIISLMLAQISENRHLAKVFEQLFSAEGSEVYLRPATEYLADGAEANYATVVESALRRGETAIGYRFARRSGDPERMFGVTINPPMSERLVASEDDRVIVLAES